MSATLPLPEPTRIAAPSVVARWARAIGQRSRTPLLDAWTPAVAVRVLRVDGSWAVWRDGARWQPVAAGTPVGDGSMPVAVEYPEDRWLCRSLTMPDMTFAEVAAAASLDATTASPFQANDLAWGFHGVELGHGPLQVDIALASRKQIDAYLDGLRDQLPSSRSAEVWAVGDAAAPLLFQGYGAATRSRQQAQRRGWLWALLALAWVGLLAVAVTPTAQLRLRAIEAVTAYDRLYQRTAPLVSRREWLTRATDQLRALDGVTADRVRAAEVLSLLTRALPDDTALLGLQITGAKISITGQTGNAAELMQKLSAQPGLRDVKAPSAANRPLGANKESFVIELELAPDAFKPVEVAAPTVPLPVPLPLPMSASATARAAPPVKPPASPFDARNAADDAARAKAGAR